MQSLFPPLNIYKKSFYFLILTATIAGCSDVPIKSNAIVNNPVEIKKETTSQPDIRAYIDRESLYDVLLGEIAARRHNGEEASKHLLLATNRTQNAQLAERTAHIAHYFRDDNRLQEAANLWVNIAPQEPRARLLLTAALTQQGQFKEAFSTMQSLLKDNQETNFMPLASAVTKASQEEQLDLLNAFNEALISHPNNIQLLASKAIILDGLGQPDEALLASEATLQHDPNLYAALHIKTRSLQLLNRQDEAIAVLEKTLEIYPEASNLRLHLARLLLESNITEASYHFGVLVEQNPNEARYRLSYALSLKQSGQSSQAISELETLLKQNQLTNEANFYLAQLYRLSEPELASNLCKHIERDNTYFLPALSLYLDIMGERSQLMTAIEYIESQQQEADSISVKLALLLSQKLVSVSLYHEAASYLRTSIDRLGPDIELRYQLALLDSQLENFSSAQKVFESILQDDPNHSGALNGLGYLLAEQEKELDRALDLVAKALKLHPDDAAIIDSLGWILYKKGNHQEAAKVLAKAHQLLKDPEISAHFIEALWQLNRRIEASDVASDAIKHFPNDQNLINTLIKFNIIQHGQP